jgi:predicted nucleic acid-binding protein
VIVYVETNFILKIALEQEEHAAAIDILQIAERREIDLAFPAFSICEPFETVTRRARERNRLSEAVNSELRQLSRSAPHREYAESFLKLATELVQIKKGEADRLEGTIERLLAVARVMPMTVSIFSAGRRYADALGLSAPDAFIYASIVADLSEHGGQPLACFLSRNSRDFFDISIRDELAGWNCRYIANFSDGFEYIRSNAGGGGNTVT